VENVNLHIELNKPIIGIDLPKYIECISKKIIGIYKIISTSGGIYIGQATDVKKRFKIYNKLGCKNQRRLYHSLKKHGVENHIFELIYVLEINNLTKSEIIKELNRLEINYIKEFNSFVDDNKEHGLNLTRGGDVGENSEETRKLKSEANMGEKNHMYGKKGKDCHNFGRKHTQEQIQANIERNIGRGKGIPSPFKGIPKSEEHKQKLRKPKRKRTAEHIKNNIASCVGKTRSGQALLNIIEAQRKRRECELMIKQERLAMSF
jgi:group I intron endonuclease